ncbi:Protein nen4 [Stylosanthes scabra]|uniref:Protein nen4 n=1 Tax=Stylosanthes scabra TaxID=79078 RepID=A0ABU6W960_9FABA|nr:Protein nen4 [Stylosanthes scabra]
MELLSHSFNAEHAPEIVFFDLETNVPKKGGERFWVLEFGAIVVSPHKLTEVESYSTLIKPKDLSVVSVRSSRSHGITRAAVEKAPSFEDVAHKIFSILDGRVWAGHNIQRFDCVRIKEAFDDINMPAPSPIGIIDSLGVLTEKFGRRAGNMKMATLASYFGLGQQKHRSLDDVRMNLEVLKHCATVLFLESSLPSTLHRQNSNWNGYPSSTIMTRSRSNGKSPSREDTSRKSPPSSLIGYQRTVPYTRGSLGKMAESVRGLVSKSQGQSTINQILKHSHSLLR